MELLYVILMGFGLLVMLIGLGMTIFQKEFLMATRVFLAGFALYAISNLGRFMLHDHSEECTHIQLKVSTE